MYQLALGSVTLVVLFRSFVLFCVVILKRVKTELTVVRKRQADGAEKSEKTWGIASKLHDNSTCFSLGGTYHNIFSLRMSAIVRG